jgi:hypothetical protein
MQFRPILQLLTSDALVCPLNDSHQTDYSFKLCIGIGLNVCPRVSYVFCPKQSAA